MLVQNILDDYELDSMIDLRVRTFTESPDHALVAYELYARQYLMKPVDPVRLFTALEHIFGGENGSIVVRDKRALRKIFRTEAVVQQIP